MVPDPGVGLETTDGDGRGESAPGAVGVTASAVPWSRKPRPLMNSGENVPSGRVKASRVTLRRRKRGNASANHSTRDQPSLVRPATPPGEPEGAEEDDDEDGGITAGAPGEDGEDVRVWW